jgi:hypothetical protein
MRTEIEREIRYARMRHDRPIPPPKLPRPPCPVRCACGACGDCLRRAYHTSRVRLLRSGKYCDCGHCTHCKENARWEKLFEANHGEFSRDYYQGKTTSMVGIATCAMEDYAPIPGARWSDYYGRYLSHRPFG